MKRITKYIGVKRQYFTPKVRLIELDTEWLLVESPTGGDGGTEKDPTDTETIPDTDQENPIDPWA